MNVFSEERERVIDNCVGHSFYCFIQYHTQKQLGEKRVYTFQFTVHNRCQERDARQELRQNP